MSGTSQSVTESPPKKNYCWAWVIFFTCALYGAFSHLLRIYADFFPNALISNQALGTTLYYATYILMQLPMGIAIEKIGVRKVLLFSLSMICVGLIIFAHTVYVDVAIAARILVAAGAAALFISALRLVVHWFPQKYFATLAGCLTGMGMLAAVGLDHYLLIRSGQLAALSSYFSLPLLCGIALFLMTAFWVRTKSNRVTYTALRESVLLSVRRVIFTPQLWCIGIVGGLLYLPAPIFVNAWAIPFLRAVHNFSASAANTGAFLTLSGWILSNFLMGFLSDYFQTRKIPLIIATLGAAASSGLLLFSPLENHIVINILLFTLGLFCGIHAICFALSIENATPHTTAIALSFTNLLIILIGVLVKPVIGVFLENLNDTLIPLNSTIVYSSWDFLMALSIIPIGLITAYFFTLFIHETLGRDKKVHAE
ncbi:MAG: hypothetical protein A3E84_00630 [Gammaproteobacteria bacterium RIFCSPHIGHO2_12_FULL_42_13]|nr:MAG: hypothetical protein A3E84_00630 [Gammaproteobacteria bacterium RIFCSPHIGHO2_12_FULL_42_13]